MALALIGSLIIHLIDILDRIVFYIAYLFKKEKSLVHDMRVKYPSDHKLSNKLSSESSIVGETPVYRHANFTHKLLDSPIPGATSVADIFDHAVKHFSDNNCMGWRRMIKMHVNKVTQKDGTVKTWEIPEFAPIKYLTFSQVAQKVDNVSIGMLQLTGLKSGDSFIMFENTCYQWMMLAQSCFRYDITVCTIYANLGLEAMIAAVQETGSSAMLVNVSSLSDFVRIAAECPQLKHVIYTRNGIVEDDEENLKRERQVLSHLAQHAPQITFTSFDDVEKLGATSNKGESIKKATETHRRPGLESLGMIMYTSGTTGKSKGVMLTHGNILASMASVDVTIGEDKTIEYRYVAYLPLAHILELIAEHVIMLRGGCIGYGSARTLSEKGAKPIGDIQAVAPSILVGVPRVFDTIKKGAKERLDNGSALVKWLFNAAYKSKAAALKRGDETPVWNMLVFNKFRKLIGGNMVLMMSGGAPLNKDSHEFMRVCFSCCFVQGYGLTETTAAVAIQGAYDTFEMQSVGAPLPSSEIKLIDVPEMGYLSTDKPFPRGEIAVRGNNISPGYFKQDHLTKEAFDKDGWFHTGDVAQIKANGALQIIDRRKNLVKLSAGEYISLENLESVYGNSKYVSPNGIMVYANSEKDQPVAVVIPQFTVLKSWASANGITSLSKSDLVKNPAVIAEVFRSFNEEGKQNKVKSFERLLGIKLYNEEWTPENGCLTAAQKLKRSHIYELHKDDIESMYQ